MNKRHNTRWTHEMMRCIIVSMFRGHLEPNATGLAPSGRRRADRLHSVDVSPTAGTVIIAISALGFGLIPFFARSLTDSGMASAAVTFFRWGMSAAVLLPFLRLSQAKLPPFLWAVGTGLGLGLGWVAYVEAVASMPVSTVGVIYMTYPLFALLAAWLVFSQRPRPRSVAGAGLVLAASTIAMSPAGLATGDLGTLAIAFAAPVSFGFAISVLTERLGLLNPIERIAATALGAVIGVSPLVLGLSRTEILPSDARGWALVIGMGLLTSLVPKIGYALAAPFVGSARAATAGAVELPTMFLIGWIAFGESLGWIEIGAALLVLAAVFLTPSRPVTWDLETKGVRRRSLVRGSR